MKQHNSPQGVNIGNLQIEERVVACGEITVFPGQSHGVADAL